MHSKQGGKNSYANNFKIRNGRHSVEKKNDFPLKMEFIQQHFELLCHGLGEIFGEILRLSFWENDRFFYKIGARAGMDRVATFSVVSSVGLESN